MQLVNAFDNATGGHIALVIKKPLTTHRVHLALGSFLLENRLLVHDDDVLKEVIDTIKVLQSARDVFITSKYTRNCMKFRN